MRSSLYIIIFLISFHACYCQTRWDSVRCNCDSVLNICRDNPCVGLTLISDSMYFYYKLNPDCINAIHKYYMKTTNIYHVIGHDFSEQGLAYYTNTSFGKSLYKMDLLLWMRYYHCLDNNNLIKKRYGDFNGSEREALKMWQRYNNNSFDTSFLSD